jgi:hypothetical protein
MKVAAFQFQGSDDVKENLLAIERGIERLESRKPCTIQPKNALGLGCSKLYSRNQ